MKWSFAFVSMLFAGGFLTGCFNPINAYNGARYYEAGLAAEHEGDLLHAQKFYSRARANAVVGFLGPREEAYTLYEWSRMTGYLSNYTDAANGFSNVLQLIDKAKPKADALLAPALCEYARLFHDTGQHERAVPLFERAVAQLDRIGAPERDPISMAEFLDDYAHSLQMSGKDAEYVAARARWVREANKEAVAKRKPRRYAGEQP